jgi:hypothetical protein
VIIDAFLSFGDGPLLTVSLGRAEASGAKLAMNEVTGPYFAIVLDMFLTVIV